MLCFKTTSSTRKSDLPDDNLTTSAYLGFDEIIATEQNYFILNKAQIEGNAFFNSYYKVFFKLILGYWDTQAPRQIIPRHLGPMDIQALRHLGPGTLRPKTFRPKTLRPWDIQAPGHLGPGHLGPRFQAQVRLS